MSKNASKKIGELGFTLIELLISIFIIVTLTSLFLANFRGGTNQRVVNSATNNLISDLHKIQSFSLSSKDVAAGQPASRYAVTFSNNATAYALLGYNNAVPAVSSTIANVNLPIGAVISTVSITKADGSVPVPQPTSVAVAFKIPFGKVVMNYSGSTTDEVNDNLKIKISSSDNAVCAYVLINGVTGNVVSQTPCP